MKKNIFLLISIFFICFSSSTFAEHNIEDIVKTIDELYRSNTSISEIEMQIETPHWNRTLKMKLWSYKMDKTFILITSPAREEGFATLRIENEMWNYMPQTDQVMKIPPSMMMGSWMGSDFTNDDLVRESSLIEDYSFQFTEVENPEEGLLYLKLTPHEDAPVVWSKIILAVRASDYLPVWEKFFGENNELVRLMNFKEIKTIGGKTIPTVMELIPQNEEGKRTVIRFISAEFDIELDDDIFTLRNLQNQ